MARVAKPGSLFFFMSKSAGSGALDSTLKNLLGQITLRRIWNDSHYTLPHAEPFRNFQRREHGGASARPCQHAFLGSQSLYRAERVLILHHHHFIAQRAVKCFWDEAGADSFYFMRPGLSAAQHRALGFDCIRQYSKRFLLQVASDSSERS